MAANNFDPNGVGLNNSNIFGLPYSFNEAEIVLLPVPWDVTTSNTSGTSNGPKAILEASPQLDLYDYDFPETWKKKIFMLENSMEIMQLNYMTRPKAKEIIRIQENGHKIADHKHLQESLFEVNESCEYLNKWVHSQCKKYMEQGKKVALVGGDHGIPLGLYRLNAEQHGEFGILQIDAHCDLRESYEGFKYSHASIMHNALQIPEVTKIVQVGTRDYSSNENDVAQSNDRVSMFCDDSINERLFNGDNFNAVCDDIINALPQKVHISFDIDGLEPSLCPGTGTPVPGGLNFSHIRYLFKKLKASKKEIISFDLVEVARSENPIDGNVGARVLYKLCGLLGG